VTNAPNPVKLLKKISWLNAPGFAEALLTHVDEKQTVNNNTVFFKDKTNVGYQKIKNDTYAVM
jgi:hypothetical protein